MCNVSDQHNYRIVTESNNTQSSKVTINVDDDHEDAIAESSVTAVPTGE